MTREQYGANYAGLVHDHHLMANKLTSFSASSVQQEMSKQQQQQNQSALSTVAILRRHSMYDSLVLVKRFNASLNSYMLEFPTSDLSKVNHRTNRPPTECYGTKLVSVYLDGDDPVYQNQELHDGKMISPPEGAQVVYVPMNGLLERLNNYEKKGIAIESKVLALAMGLNISERLLTTCTEKELQETP